jgi:hypothetical protein
VVRANNRLFFTLSSGSRNWIGTCALDGSDLHAHQIRLGENPAYSLATAGQYLYWTQPGSRTQPSYIGRLSLGSGRAQPRWLDTKVVSPNYLTASKGSLYFSWGYPNRIGAATLDGNRVDHRIVHGYGPLAVDRD